MRASRLAALAILAGSLGGALPAQEGDIEWLSDYREALQLARQTRKPLVVEFRCEA